MHEIAIADTVNWLEKAVIGLNLCPFAKGVHVKGQIHYTVSDADDVEGVARALHRELLAKQYKYNRPGLETLPWGEQGEVHDPFGNRIRFCEQRHEAAEG